MNTYLLLRCLQFRHTRPGEFRSDLFQTCTSLYTSLVREAVSYLVNPPVASPSATGADTAGAGSVTKGMGGVVSMVEAIVGMEEPPPSEMV